MKYILAANPMVNLKSAVKEMPMLHFCENEFLVNMKTLLVSTYFDKILSDLTLPSKSYACFNVCQITRLCCKDYKYI